MRCDVKIDLSCPEPYVCIVAAKLTQEVQDAIRFFQTSQIMIQGYQDDKLYLLQQSEVLRVYAERQKVFAQTPQGIYTLHRRLYEMEEILSAHIFVRISNSEIINSRHIHHLDISLIGTIGVYLDGGIKTYASRRYVPRIKQFFGIIKENKK